MDLSSPEAPVPSAMMGAADALDPLLQEIVGHLPPGGLHVDLGSGRGRLLQLSREAGNIVLGVDDDSSSAAVCEALGIQVVLGDALETLAGLAHPIDAITAVHLVEHLHPDQAEDLFKRSAVALRKGGVFALVTPNFRDWRVAREIFWLDPTHVRPYPALLLETWAVRHGFRTLVARNVFGLKGHWRQRLAFVLGRVRYGADFGRMNALLLFEKI